MCLQEEAINKSLVSALLEVEASPKWEKICVIDDVVVSKIDLSPGFRVADRTIGEEVSADLHLSLSISSLLSI